MLEQCVRGATDAPRSLPQWAGQRVKWRHGGTDASYQLSRRVTLRMEGKKKSQNVSGCRFTRTLRRDSFCAMRELNSKNRMTQLKCAICSCRCNISSSFGLCPFHFLLFVANSAVYLFVYFIECHPPQLCNIVVHRVQWQKKGAELNWTE